MAPSSNAATFALFAAMCLVFASLAVPAHASTNTIADKDEYKDCIGKPNECTSLALNSKSLTGTIPSELGGLTALTKLWLYQISLDGPIFPALMLLHKNLLTGTIPSALSGLTVLASLCAPCPAC
mmetsp:Transcript_45036/g.103971  ORF Transcript_45036/g.103971 Transcript_45036/m.103971 type:complete len:125 (-) Transcript_45036:365-739(-)